MTASTLAPSEARLRANRRNALMSHGPVSADGKARVSQNALAFGLSLPVLRDPICEARVASLAHALAGPEPHPRLWDLACRFAEAEVELERIRVVRIGLLNQCLEAAGRANATDPATPPSPAERSRLGEDPVAQPDDLAASMVSLPGLKGRSRTSFGIGLDQAAGADTQPRRARNREARPGNPLAALIRSLSALLRYEQRACSRRLRALREWAAWSTATEG